MDDESWMNANKAVELGFADGILKRNAEDVMEQPAVSMIYSKAVAVNSLKTKIAAKCHIETKEIVKERSVDECLEKLDLLKNHI
jgi:ATP-dependent Clp protease protease subunit